MNAYVRHRLFYLENENCFIFLLASGDFSGVATGEGGVAGWENGTLSVSRAERRHEGRYLCEADNGVGAGLSKSVTLSVNGKWLCIYQLKV